MRAWRHSNRRGSSGRRHATASTRTSRSKLVRTLDLGETASRSAALFGSGGDVIPHSRTRLSPASGPAELLHCAACHQIPEVHGDEARVLEQGAYRRLRYGVVTRDKDHSLPAA